MHLGNNYRKSAVDTCVARGIVPVVPNLRIINIFSPPIVSRRGILVVPTSGSE